MKKRPLLIVVIAVVLLLILALASPSGRTPTFLENVAGGVITPVQSFASSVSGAIINFVRDIFNTSDADLENKTLEAKVAQLEQTVSQLNEIKAENERLKGLLEFKDSNTDIKSISARIIGKSPGVWFDIFLVNAGRNSGVEKDMPVISGNGLVGCVTQVGATWCKVTAIIDPSLTVSTIVERTRDNGIIRGGLSLTSEDSVCQMHYLPYDNDLVPGDKVLTSGLGGVYPKGLLVGEVIEVSRKKDGLERDALVKPSVDFSRLEEVSIITAFPKTEEVK